MSGEINWWTLALFEPKCKVHEKQGNCNVILLTGWCFLHKIKQGVKGSTILSDS